MIDETKTTPETLTSAPISGALTQTTDEIAPQTLELIETTAPPERLLLATPLNEYTVTEGLLLLILVLLLVKSFVGLVREVL